jgi:hypothetical protein
VELRSGASSVEDAVDQEITDQAIRTIGKFPPDAIIILQTAACP